MSLLKWTGRVIGACCLAIGTAGWLEGGARDGTLDIYWVDSNGGGSTLLVTPNDESILIDTGNPGGRDSGRIHQVATEVAGLKQIDHLITTHLHVDHYGGAPELARLMPIRNVYDNGVTDRDPDGRDDASWPLRIKGYREMRVERRVVAIAGQSIPLKEVVGGPSLGITFVMARKQLEVSGERPCADPNPQPVDTSDNANSIVTLLQFGGFRYFNGGDLTWNTEATLACPAARLGSVDVYQVNHHGMDISNNPLLIRMLAPTVSVMNNGPEKGCGPKTFETLKSLPSLQGMYQVHWNVRADEAHNAAVEHCANKGRGTGGNIVQLSVARNARTYEVKVPSTGHQRKYQTRL